MLPSSTACAAGTWAARSGKPSGKVGKQVKLPAGYHINCAGEYESQQRAARRLAIIIPLTLMLIFLILYSMFGVDEVVGADPDERRHGARGRAAGPLVHRSQPERVVRRRIPRPCSASRCRYGVNMVEYINQLRVRGHTIFDAAVEGAVLRLRPIMMTMLVAMLGLLPAATSHGIGSDSQRPFAIVIVGGLTGRPG